MKYMIMMFGDAAPMMETQSPEWIKEMIQFMHTLNDELTTAGEFVEGHGLADSTRAKTVRLTDGAPVATDGPYAESKESIIGFWIVDVADEARVVEIAGRIAHYAGVVEVRPVMSAPPEIE